MKKTDIEKELKKALTRSAWRRGVYEYARELLAGIDERYNGELPEILNEHDALNGARGWLEYSQSGSALIWDKDIAKRLCTASEYKKTRGGLYQPNNRENWVQVQARALYQAYKILAWAWANTKKEGA